jgi:hypothetical protein
MPRTRRLLPLALGLAFAILAPLPATAAPPIEPPRPVLGYRPAFVTETDGPRPYKDCLWSSGSMLLDKWTTGRETIGHAALRRLSGDPANTGSTLDDLRLAFSKLGHDLPTSPDNGLRLTWSELVKRLAAGAGAVVAGDYGRLPARYSRWDPAFAKQVPAGHALYLDAYDRRTDRIFVMDPLAPADWTGEWIPARAIRAFTWRTGNGIVHAAVTPTAKALPFAGVKLDAPATTIVDATAVTTWPIAEAPAGWTPAGVTFVATTTRLDDGIAPPDVLTIRYRAPDPTAVVAVDPWRSPGPSPAALAEGRPWLDGSAVAAGIALPAQPGAYLLGGYLLEHRFGERLAGAGEAPPVVVYVEGPWRATIAAEPTVVRAGDRLRIPVEVTNSGSTWWTAPPPTRPSLPAVAFGWTTHVVATWVPADPEVTLVPPPVALGSLGLAPDATTTLAIDLSAPSTPGAWSVRLDVVDSALGSFAALGSVPALVSVYVLPAPGDEPVG